jgi:hypothetical protein
VLIEIRTLCDTKAGWRDVGKASKENLVALIVLHCLCCNFIRSPYLSSYLEWRFIGFSVGTIIVASATGTLHTYDRTWIFDRNS